MLEVDEGVARPEPLPELIARDDLARSFEERGKNLKGLIRKIQTAAGLSQLARADVQFEDAEADDVTR